MDADRHEYRLKWWTQLWYLAWGVLCSALSIGCLVAGIDNWREFWTWKTSAITITFPALAYYFLALALRSRVVLDGQRITVRYVGKEKSATINDIRGYRISITKNASFWRLELSGGGNLSIMRSFDVDDHFRAFLSQLKELDNPNLLRLLR